MASQKARVVNTRAFLIRLICLLFLFRDCGQFAFIKPFPITGVAQDFARRNVCKNIVTIVPLNKLTNVIVNTCVFLAFPFKKSKRIVHILIGFRFQVKIPNRKKPETKTWYPEPNTALAKARVQAEIEAEAFEKQVKKEILGNKYLLENPNITFPRCQ